MRKKVFVIVGLILFSLNQLTAQQYTAIEYWRMEQDSVYKSLITRQNAGDTLSLQEQNTLTDYMARLREYFDKLSDNEKSLYYLNRSAWAGRPEKAQKIPVRQEPDIFTGETSMYTQYLISSGIFGAIYGGEAVAILGLGNNEGAATSIPLLAAGASVLIPVLTIKDKYIPYNSLSLSIQGKAIGALQGLALGALLTGDNVEEGKLLMAISAASSIGLGKLGYYLGKTKPWSEGRVALYAHYGVLLPLEGLAIVGAVEAEDPRIYGLTSLAFGVGGYLIADQIANKNDLTKGDVNAIGTLAVMNGLLGMLIVSDIEEDSDVFKSSDLLIPAAGALAGTLIGHLSVKNAGLTNQQGRNIALASAGGSAIGLGLVSIFTPEKITPYYVLPYITGMTTYAITLGIYKKKNNLTLTENRMHPGWDLDIMPQNIFLNKKIAPFAFANPGKRIDFLPAFAAKFRF